MVKLLKRRNKNLKQEISTKIKIMIFKEIKINKEITGHFKIVIILIDL